MHKKGSRRSVLRYCLAPIDAVHRQPDIRFCMTGLSPVATVIGTVATTIGTVGPQPVLFMLRFPDTVTSPQPLPTAKKPEKIGILVRNGRFCTLQRQKRGKRPCFCPSWLQYYRPTDGETDFTRFSKLKLRYAYLFIFGKPLIMSASKSEQKLKLLKNVRCNLYTLSGQIEKRGTIGLFGGMLRDKNRT